MASVLCQYRNTTKGISNMKSIIFCLLLVSMVVMKKGVEARKKFIEIEAADPCRKPGGWHPGCPTLPKPSRPYTRGCSTMLQCRHGHKRG